jgi:hypothetical protein
VLPGLFVILAYQLPGRALVIATLD